MKRPALTWEVLLAGGLFLLLLCMALVLASMLGCRRHATQPRDVFEGAREIEYIEPFGVSRLYIRRDYTAVLVTVVSGNECPDRGRAGAVVDVARAFVGMSLIPEPGDVVKGDVVQSNAVDTFVVTTGAFEVIAIDRDTLAGHAWVRLANVGVACSQDSLSRGLTLVRQRQTRR